MNTLKSQNRLNFSVTPSASHWFLRNVSFLGLLCLILMGLFQSSAAAQEDQFLVFGSVKMDDTNKRLLGVKVVVFQDGSPYDELFTDAKGDYDFELPLRHDYTFSFELEGHSNKRIEVDASGIPETTLGNRNMDLDMTLFPLPPGFDERIFESPYGRGAYDDGKNTVVFDSNFTVRMRNKVQAEFARLERLEGELEQMQENFEEFVKKGDQSVGRQEWQQAVDFYDSALALFPDEANAISKRASAQVKLDEFLASGASEAAFLAKLDEGRVALEADRLDEAIEVFEAAASMQPDSPEPAAGLRDVESRREELEKEGEYNEMIAEADNLFDREQYEKAIKTYNDASDLKPSERYPRDRQQEAQTRLDDLASESASIVERTIAYEALLDEANDLYRGDDYAAALVKYEEASRLLPAERLPQQRAEECRERIAEAEGEEAERIRRETERAEREASSAQLRELRLQYDAINDEADILFRNDDYAAAIVKYGEALEVLPDERYPLQRLTEAQRRLDEASAKAEAKSSSKDRDQSQADDRAERASEQEAEEERQARDNRRAEEAAQEAADDEAASASEEAARDADSLLEAEERQARDDRRAEEAADEAAQDEAERKERETRNAEADAASDEAALLDVAFNRLIEEADGAYNRSDWDAANAAYAEALELKPEDRYASGRMARIAKKQDASETAEEADDNAARQAALEDEKADAALEAERAAASAAQSTEAERERRLDAERERADQVIAERKRQEEKARSRAQQLASVINNPESEEVEQYYKEALKSEERSRYLEIEKKKRSAAELEQQAARSAQVRREDDLSDNQDLERNRSAMVQNAGMAQDRRVDALADKKNDYSKASGQSARTGVEQQTRGKQRVEDQKSKSARLQRNRSRDYALVVPELERKKRSWSNLFKGVNRAAADRRSINTENAEAKTRQYRTVGNGASVRAQERLMEIRKKEQRSNRRLSKRKTEADRRAYDARLKEQDRITTATDDKDKYVLSEDDQEVLMGIHEESYDIPNGLVIERTVRRGNQVVRYRKVVTKTGVYYFKGDRSITVNTWKRETSIVLD